MDQIKESPKALDESKKKTAEQNSQATQARRETLRKKPLKISTEIPLQKYKEEDSDLFDYDNYVLLKKVNEVNQAELQRESKNSCNIFYHIKRF